ncbi:MAG: 5'-nucleotidase C-terminal domain-containing protein [Chromatiales bacterium]|nr:5'-nucleotidase C-terminal domain-containing protein [Chromatiales bacterium]
MSLKPLDPLNILGLVFLSLALGITARGLQPAAEPTLRILWTNDTHGYLSPLFHREEGDYQFVDRAREEGRSGGMAHMAAAIDQQRQRHPDRTLLVDSGDTWHGTAVPVRLAGKPVVEVMNAMGYDAMVPGNVDLFYDQGTVEALFEAAEFPIVAANFYDAEWGERADLPNLKPYIVRELNGIKVGIIGMTYHWMSKVTNHPQWSFGLRLDEVQADVDNLRNKQDVDVVILLSHMGWKVDAKFAEMVNGIDVVIGAHTHDALYRPDLVHNAKSQRGVIIVQSGSHGKLLGQLDLHIANKRVVEFEQTLFPIRANQIEPDREIAAMIEKFRAPYKEELERVIGKAETVIYRQGTWQSTGDNLVTDALRERTGQNISVAEPGRYGASILPGDITVEDVFNLVPTEAPVHTMKFYGRDIQAMLEAAVDNVVTDDILQKVGSNMWRFSGVELVVDLTKKHPNRIQKITVDGQPLAADRLYSLAEFNLFLRNSPLAVDGKKTHLVGPHEIIAYIEDRGTVAPALDHRLATPQGDILGDHLHLPTIWQEAGKSEVTTG